jgi:hypothetical protein
MDQILTYLAGELGVDQPTLILILLLLTAASNILGKSIPASATGPLGIVRKIALVVGLYIPQRLTPNVSTQTVAAAIAAEVPDATIKAGAKQLKESVATGIASGVVSNAIGEIAASTSERTPAP